MILNHHNKFLTKQTSKGIESFVKSLFTSDLIKGNLKTVGRLLLGKMKDIAKNILLPAAKTVAADVGSTVRTEASKKLQALLQDRMQNLQNKTQNQAIQGLLQRVSPIVQDTGQNIISNLMSGSGFRVIPNKRK